MSLAGSLLDQSARFWVSCQVQASMSPCILNGKVHSERHKALEDFELRISRSLVNAIVSVNILVKRVHSRFHE